MKGFKIKKEETFNVLLIEESAPELEVLNNIKEYILQLFTEEKVNIVFDIQKCAVLSPETLSTFLFVKRVLLEAQKTFVISNPSTEIMKFIDISNLTEQFNITPTLNEAYDFVAMEEIERELGGFDELDL